MIIWPNSGIAGSAIWHFKPRARPFWTRFFSPRRPCRDILGVLARGSAGVRCWVPLEAVLDWFGEDTPTIESCF
jgi:hypothetical protein